MNERIKELSKEAAVVYQRTLPPATHTTPLHLIDKLGKNAKAGGIEIISDGFCEKFAKLIIKECCAATEGQPRSEIRNSILNHFGLEVKDLRDE